MKNKIGKEFIIIILLFAVIMFTVIVLFYDAIPEKNSDISSINENIIEDSLIQDSEENIKTEVQNTSLKTYSVKQEDIDEYEAQKKPATGKKNPFEGVLDNTVDTQNEKSDGTFFENKSLK